MKRIRVTRTTTLKALGALVVMACLLAPFVLRPTLRFYTDGSALREDVKVAQPALREVLWQPARQLTPAVNRPGVDDYEPAVSPDGRYLAFTRGRPGGQADLWIAERSTGGWGAAHPLEMINTAFDEMGAAFATTGPGAERLVLYFSSDRTGGEGGYDVWASISDGEGGWGIPQNLGPQINSAFSELRPSALADSSLLFFATNRRAGQAPQPPRWTSTVREILDSPGYDIFEAPRLEGGKVEFGEALLVSALSLPDSTEGSIAVAPQGDFVYFASNRAGGQGGFDLYRSRLAEGQLGPPENLGPRVNTPGHELDPALALGGFELYFARRPEGGADEDIFVTRSREVFLASEAGETYWSASAVLAFLRNVLRRTDPSIVALLLSFFLCLLFAALFGRRMSSLATITRCFLLALLVHLIAALWMNSSKVHRVIMGSLGPREGFESLEVSVEEASEEHVGFAIRGQVAETGGDAAPAYDTGTLISPAVLSTPEIAPRASSLELKPADLSAVASVRVGMSAAVPVPEAVRPSRLGPSPVEPTSVEPSALETSLASSTASDPAFAVSPGAPAVAEAAPTRVPRKEFADRVDVATPPRAELRRMAVALDADVAPEALSFRDQLTGATAPEPPPDLATGARENSSDPQVALSVVERDLTAAVAGARTLAAPERARAVRPSAVDVERGVPAERAQVEADRALARNASRPEPAAEGLVNVTSARRSEPTRDAEERRDANAELPAAARDDSVSRESPAPRGVAPEVGKAMPSDRARDLDLRVSSSALKVARPDAAAESVLAALAPGDRTDSPSRSFEAPSPSRSREAVDPVAEAETRLESRQGSDAGAPGPGSRALGSEASPRPLSTEKPEFAFSRREGGSPSRIERADGIALQTSEGKPAPTPQIEQPVLPQSLRDRANAPSDAAAPLPEQVASVEKEEFRILPRGVGTGGAASAPRPPARPLLAIEPGGRASGGREDPLPAGSALEPSAFKGEGEDRGPAAGVAPAVVRASTESTDRGEPDASSLPGRADAAGSPAALAELRQLPGVAESPAKSLAMGAVTLSTERRTLADAATKGGGVARAAGALELTPSLSRPQESSRPAEPKRTGTRESASVPDLATRLPAPTDATIERDVGPRALVRGGTERAASPPGSGLAIASRSPLALPGPDSASGASLKPPAVALRDPGQPDGAVAPVPRPRQAVERSEDAAPLAAALPVARSREEPAANLSHAVERGKSALPGAPAAAFEVRLERRGDLTFAPETFIAPQAGSAAPPGSIPPRPGSREPLRSAVPRSKPSAALKVSEELAAAPAPSGAEVAPPRLVSPLSARRPGASPAQPSPPAGARLSIDTPAGTPTSIDPVRSVGSAPARAERSSDVIPGLASPAIRVGAAASSAWKAPSRDDERPRLSARSEAVTTPERSLLERTAAREAAPGGGPGVASASLPDLARAVPRRVEREPPRLEVAALAGLPLRAAPEKGTPVAARVKLPSLAPRGDAILAAASADRGPRLPPGDGATEATLVRAAPLVVPTERTPPETALPIPPELLRNARSLQLVPERAPILSITEGPSPELTELAATSSDGERSIAPPRRAERLKPSRSLALSGRELRSPSHSAREPGSLEAVQAASSFVPKIYQLRSRTRREEAVKLGGGSEETERAVELGLKWLAIHQSPDGRWSLEDFMKHLRNVSERDRWHPDWDGRGRNDSRGGTSRAEGGDTAATALALLALMGHGDTQFEPGPYQEVVRRGLQFLKTCQKRDGDLRNGGNLYMHAIATFALCEAFALTRDPELEEPARRAMGFAIRGQNPDLGGWRYEPYPQGRDVDTSVFGWMLMAVKSAHLGGIEIDKRAIQRMAKYLDSARMSKAGGRFAYQPGLPRASLAMTAQGMFCQQILTELRPPQTEEEKLRLRRAANESVTILLSNRPERRDQDGGNSYYWYYATLALFQEEGVAWETWNTRMKDVLLELQLREDQGTAAGSWDPLDRRAQLGGRVYSTAISILCLEVYYRYAPKDRK